MTMTPAKHVFMPNGSKAATASPGSPCSLEYVDVRKQAGDQRKVEPMSVPRDRIYGQWGGCPKGYPEDKSRCVESIYPRYSVGGTQCSRKRGYGPGGEYCKQHDPERIATRKKEQERQNSLRRKAEDERWMNHQYDRAAGEYCRRLGLTKKQLDTFDGIPDF